MVVQDVEFEENIENIENNMDNVMFEEKLFAEITSETENEEYLDDEEYDQEQHKVVTLDVEHAFITYL